MKKVISYLLLLIIFILILSTKHVEAKIGVSAQCAVLMESHTKRVLYEKEPHLQRSVASISKIMTAIIAIENKNLDDYILVSKKATEQIGSSLYLKEGEEITLRDLIYGLMLRSGNDAAYLIAEHVGGSIENFVYLMNEKAKSLGMYNSIFENPSGLDEDSKNISTAYDMALITKYAMDNPLFREINNTSTYRAKTKDGNVYVWHNKHRLINRYDYIIGGKTGFTKQAKRTLVSVGNKNNLELIVVTLNGGDDWNDHLNLFNYGFSEFDLYTLMKKGIFEVKELNKIFYLDDKLVYPMKKEEYNQFKIFIEYDEKNAYLLLVKDEEVFLRKEIKEYDKNSSVLKDSITIEDIWRGMIFMVREIFW